MSIVKQMLRVHSLLAKLREGAISTQEKEWLSLAIDALGFISDVGQPHGFEAYREDRAVKGPPLVIAAFDARGDAEAWMKNHPEPPHHAHVLIAGEYFYTGYEKDSDLRVLVRSDTLSYYLEDMTQEGLPAPVAVFAAHDEAKAWLNSQPEPPRQVFITIAGEYYLAVYHYKINLRALYPVSMAAETEREEK